jgi:hypothetical protein
MKSRLNFSQRTYQIYSIGPKTPVLGRFGPFRYCTKVEAKLAELIFCGISERTDVIHSIGSKTHILGRFGPFHYSTKVDAKQAELVPLTHKFAK